MDDQPVEFVFNSQLRSFAELTIIEKSSFQAYYRGYVQVTMKLL